MSHVLSDYYSFSFLLEKILPVKCSVLDTATVYHFELATIIFEEEDYDKAQIYTI